MTSAAPPVTSAQEGYLLLADISGYTGFMENVGETHGVDFSEGIPPAFALIGTLLDSVVDGLVRSFEVAKFEGDAVFAVAPVGDLDGKGSDLLATLRETYRRFIEARTEADPARIPHDCSACMLVNNLDLKMALHEGPYISQVVQRQNELLGPAVNLVHRMLKSSVADEVGHRHYLHLTDAAAVRLGLSDMGIAHQESYSDVGDVPGRVLDLSAD
jgi:class 3 adenylate cyclase